MKYTRYISLLGLLLPASWAAPCQAQTLCDFETADSYKAVGIYDTWENSPFRAGGQLEGKGNAAVTANPDAAEDPILGFAPNGSANVLGAQRSRFGSNTFGAMVTLKEPFALTRQTQYVHVKMLTPTDSRVMLIGMGRRTDRPWQPVTTEQFWVTSTSKVTPGKWFDAVFAVSGADGIDIHNLLVVPELESPHNRTDDFLFYIDDIELSNVATPRFTTAYYPINYDEAQATTSNNRYLNQISLTVSGGTAQTIDVNQNSEKLLYIKRLDQTFAAKAGERVTPAFSWNGNWMHGYVYLDVDRNGKYDVAYDANKNLTEDKDLMAYSYFNGKNSTGASSGNNPGVNPPAFTVPADLQPGVYRMRYKVDWDDVEPGGSTVQSIVDNGGAIVDTRLVVHEDNVTISRGTRPNGGGLNGDVLKADGSEFTQETIPFGQPYTLKVQPAPGFKFSHLILRHGFNLDGDSLVYDTPQYVDTRIPSYLFTDNTCTIPAKYIDGDVIVIPYFSSDDGQTSDDYVLNFSEDLTISRTDRKLNSFTMNATQGGESVVTLVTSPNKVYRKMLDNEVSVVPGDQVTTTVSYQGNSMHGYLYVDYNQDGRFDAQLTDAGVPDEGSELVSFTFYQNKNSLGEAKTGGNAGLNPPVFTVPADLPAGNYRARFKIDWANIDPAGQWKENGGAGDNQIDANGGYVVDFLLNVHPVESKLDVLTTHGSVVGSGNTGLPATVAYGQSLGLLPVAAASGYEAEAIIVRHGHNLDGEQYIHGNRQWSEFQTACTAYTLPADSVNGEVRITVNFQPNGTEEYKLLFGDEFNEPDGTMPDERFWTRCSNQPPAWKRFTAQTEAGQRMTGYMEDGKLVMRCLANPFDDEINSQGNRMDMISGAIESSSKVHFTYGKVEGRLKTLPHSGNFPALWMMPQDNSAGWPYAGEIDIWEQINSDNTSWHTIHTRWANSTADGSECMGQSGNPQKSGTAACTNGDYHTFGLEWLPTKLIWYVDGKQVFSYAKATSSYALNNGQWPFDKDFYLILNQSVGNGSWASAPDLGFVYETLFDWVRVYQTDEQTGISSLRTDESLLDYYVSPGRLRVVAAQEQFVHITDAAGRSIYAASLQGNVNLPLSQGVYLLNGQKILVP